MSYTIIWQHADVEQMTQITSMARQSPSVAKTFYS